MKSLSIQQPWAWLIVHGYKPVENRTWPTAYQGALQIHAGKKIDREGYAWVKQNFPEIALPNWWNLPTGGIVGRATLVDCVTAHPSRWFSGPYGFVLVNPCPLLLVQCPGRLGFFDVTV